MRDTEETQRGAVGDTTFILQKEGGRVRKVYCSECSQKVPARPYSKGSLKARQWMLYAFFWVIPRGLNFI